MEISKQLIDCLNQNNVQYEILHHSQAVTAQRIAEAEHIKGRHQAKVVMLKSGDQHLMVVLPADHHIDLEKIEKVIGKSVSLDEENEFKSLFPDSAIGAMPPFGNLYGLPTYVEKHLAEQDYIVFEAGTHTEAIKMSYSDYEKIVNPKVEDLAIKLHPMKRTVTASPQLIRATAGSSSKANTGTQSVMRRLEKTKKPRSRR